MIELFRKIRELTQKDNKTILEKTLKLSEETGEVAQAVLSNNKTHGCEYKNLTEDDIAEECVDVIIVALSILYHLNTEDSTIRNLINRKIHKWEEKINKII